MQFEVTDEVDPFHESADLGDQTLSNHVGSSQLLLREFAVGLEHELHSFAKVDPRFLECLTLGIGTRKLLDESHVAPLRSFSIDSSQFERHATLLVERESTVLFPFHHPRHTPKYLPRDRDPTNTYRAPSSLRAAIPCSAASDRAPGAPSIFWIASRMASVRT